MKKTIYTSLAPEPVGPYSQAIQAGSFLYCSGQIAIEPKTNEFLNSNIEVQTTKVMQNIEALLNEAGYSFDDVIKTTCFLDDMNNFAKFNEIYAKYFTENCPARVCVEVSRLPKDVLIEIDVIAAK